MLQSEVNLVSEQLYSFYTYKTDVYMNTSDMNMEFHINFHP
jgi:hypothetical protein